MKLNERQRALAESALQAPEWKEDRTASWGVLLAGIIVVGIVSGPMTALVCIGMALAMVIIFSIEPFSGLVLMLAALIFGGLSLHSQEVLFALGYLVLVIIVGAFWILRNIRFENNRAASLEEQSLKDEDK